MKKILYCILLLITTSVVLYSCKEIGNYEGGGVSPYIPLYDLRTIYKGADVKLTVQNMYGSDKITGVVVSDHSGKNMPVGLLVIQDKRRLNQLRGISIPLGAEATNYVSGDSVVVKIEGGTLSRVNGLLEIIGISPANVTKVSSGKDIPANRVPSSYILADPDKYESTLVAIVKGGFDPLPTQTDILSGDKVLNDGFDNITLHTEAAATFANKSKLPVVGNFFGIVFNHADDKAKLIPEVRLRKENDVIYLSSEIEITPIIITGFIADVKGGDGNYEYMQFIATKNLDFGIENFSVVVTNNAGASTPTGFPSKGWATGALATKGNARTFKFNLISGTVLKGQFFYVGGSGKLINGASSTDISSSKWIRAFNYTNTNGDGFGQKTSGLFPNSGNASGCAVFKGINVDVDSKPIDVVFIGGGGSLFSNANTPMGYKIANTDFYDVINPITLESQPYYKAGSNTISFNYLPPDVGYFNKLGGIYDPKLGKWVKARTQNGVVLTKTSILQEIEGVFPAPDPTIPDDTGVPATTLKQ